VRVRSQWNLLDSELLGWMFEGAQPLPFVRNLFQLRPNRQPLAAPCVNSDLWAVPLRP